MTGTPTTSRPPRCSAALRLPAVHSRRGLAPLEFIIALPFLLVLVTLIVMMHDVCVTKARTNILSRNAAWSYRHDVSSDTEYDSPKLKDPTLGGLLDTVATVDDQIRWFQLGKIMWASFDGVNIPYQAHKGVQKHEAQLDVWIAPITTMRRKTIKSQHVVLGGTWDYQHIKFYSDGRRLPLVPDPRCFVFLCPSFDAQGYTKYLYGGASILSNLLGGGLGDLVKDLTGLAGATGINPSDPTNGKQADADAKAQQALDTLNKKIADMEDYKRRMNAPKPTVKEALLHPIDSAARLADIAWARTQWTFNGGQAALDKYYSTRTDLQNQLNKGKQLGSGDAPYNKPPSGIGLP